MSKNKNVLLNKLSDDVKEVIPTSRLDNQVVVSHTSNINELTKRILELKLKNKGGKVSIQSLQQELDDEIKREING